MPFVEYLKCSKCGSIYHLKEKPVMCERGDLGRLDVYYNYDEIKKRVNKRKLFQREFSMWRYLEFMPIQDSRNIVSLDEGGTPLIKSKRLAEHLKLKNLYLKDETRNPTGSFKDRAMSIAVSMAVEFGFNRVTTASSGNAAAALAAYASRVGIETYAFVLEDASYGKIAQLLLYGAKVFRVKWSEGRDDPTVEMLKLVVERYRFYPAPSFGPFNPYQIEGPKTISYEIIEQLNWTTPDSVFVPVGAAALLTGVWRGFKDFIKVGFINDFPRLIAIQSKGNAPFVRAFKEKHDPQNILPWKKPNTIATGLSDPYPWDGDAGLKALHETRGLALDVNDEKILEAMKLLASKEGIFAEPSGATALAGLTVALDSGLIDRDEKIVVLVTGHGLKDPAIIEKICLRPPIIKPSLSSFKEKLNEIYGISI